MCTKNMLSFSPTSIQMIGAISTFKRVKKCFAKSSSQRKAKNGRIKGGVSVAWTSERLMTLQNGGSGMDECRFSVQLCVGGVVSFLFFAAPACHQHSLGLLWLFVSLLSCACFLLLSNGSPPHQTTTLCIHRPVSTHLDQIQWVWPCLTLLASIQFHIPRLYLSSALHLSTRSATSTVYTSHSLFVCPVWVLSTCFTGRFLIATVVESRIFFINWEHLLPNVSINWV